MATVQLHYTTHDSVQKEYNWPTLQDLSDQITHILSEAAEPLFWSTLLVSLSALFLNWQINHTELQSCKTLVITDTQNNKNRAPEDPSMIRCEVFCICWLVSGSFTSKHKQSAVRINHDAVIQTTVHQRHQLDCTDNNLQLCVSLACFCLFVCSFISISQLQYLRWSS